MTSASWLGWSSSQLCARSSNTTANSPITNQLKASPRRPRDLPSLRPLSNRARYRYLCLEYLAREQDSCHHGKHRDGFPPRGGGQVPRPLPPSRDRGNQQMTNGQGVFGFGGEWFVATPGLRP